MSDSNGVIEETTDDSRRISLHNLLLEVCDNVYYRPPENYQMRYPCIVYQKIPVKELYSNNYVYMANDRYRITFIDPDPDSTLHEKIYYGMSGVRLSQIFTKDNLNHVVLELYY